MSSSQPRRATTLSISLTPELASEVSSRVESGLYTSASELIREALRMLLRSEAEGSSDPLGGDASDLPLSAVRFQAASELMNAGRQIRAQKSSRQQKKLEELAAKQEAGPGLRVATDRLKKLKLDESD